MDTDQANRVVRQMALGGPASIAFVTIGSFAVGVGLSGRSGSHSDAWIVIGGIAIVLGYLEMALARRLAQHELVEFRQYERVANIADDAAQAAVLMTRAAREQMQAIEEFRRQTDEQRQAVEDLAARVIRIEQRVMRAAHIPTTRKGEV